MLKYILLIQIVSIMKKFLFYFLFLSISLLIMDVTIKIYLMKKKVLNIINRNNMKKRYLYWKSRLHQVIPSHLII